MSSRILALLAAAVGLAAARPVAAQRTTPRWTSDRPCQAALGRAAFATPPVSGEAPSGAGCRDRRCAHLRGGGVVCQCLSDTLRTFDVSGVGARPLRFVRDWGSARPDSFEVVQADLDGDGSAEIVIAIWDAMSNGMGVTSWTILALTPGRYDWIVDSLAVQEYSTAGSWLALPGERRCNLLQTTWVNGFESGRGDGLYLQGTWQTLESGLFTQRTDRPVLRRRFLDSFDRERSDTTIRDAPWAWLRRSGTVAAPGRHR